MGSCGWGVEGRSQQAGEKSCAAGIRQALQAMSPRSTQQTTQSLEVRFMPSWRTLRVYFVVPLFSGAALLCGAVQLLARGVRVFF